MKRYKYSCDGGSLLLGNENFTASYMNHYGDGTHHVYIKKSGEKIPDDCFGKSIYDRLHFEGSVEGRFNVYNYDCLSTKELADPKNILETLEGRWGVYSVIDDYSGDMILEQW